MARPMDSGEVKAFRNAVPGELAVRLRPTRIVVLAGLSD
jgi:hypothetical protein